MGSYGRCVSQRGHGKIVLGQERMVTWSNTEVPQSVRQAGATQRRGKEGLLEEDRRATPSSPWEPQLLSLPLAHPDLVKQVGSVPFLPSSHQGSSGTEAWEWGGELR